MGITKYHGEVKAVKLAYCDYIAFLIYKGLYMLKANGEDDVNGTHIGLEIGRVKWDTSENGSFLSTKKFINVFDQNGKKYKITIEEAV